MEDLVQAFFTRDLSVAEQGSLSQLLEGSPDAALSYEKLLEQNYLATGLPQPSLPKSLQSLPQSGTSLIGWNGAAKLLVAVLVLGGAAIWKYWPSAKSGISLATQQPSVLPAPEKELSVPVRHRLRKPAPVEPQASGPSQEGNELSVVVNSPQKSLVTVRILDPTGDEIRVLYTGFIEAGKWTFHWDGLLENGEAAGAGDYRIDVQTGSTHLFKDLKIKLRPSAP